MLLIHMLHRQMFWHFRLCVCSAESKVKVTYYTLMELAAPRRVGRTLSSKLSLGIQHYSKYTSVEIPSPSPPPSTANSQVTEQHTT